MSKMKSTPILLVINLMKHIYVVINMKMNTLTGNIWNIQFTIMNVKHNNIYYALRKVTMVTNLVNLTVSTVIIVVMMAQ